MEAKDGSFGFDFGGVYDKIKTNELIAYTIGDGRTVKVSFTQNGNTKARFICLNLPILKVGFIFLL
jgi:uncharacterized protein YndB with AHSA1/START domain